MGENNDMQDKTMVSFLFVLPFPLRISFIYVSK